MKTKNLFFGSFFTAAVLGLSLTATAQHMAQTGAPYAGDIRHVGGKVGIGVAPTALLDIRNNNGSLLAFNLTTQSQTLARFTSSGGFAQPSLTLKNVSSGFNMQVQSTVLGGIANFSLGVSSHAQALTIEEGTGNIGINTLPGTSLQSALEIHRSGQAIMIQADNSLPANSQACDIVFENPSTGGTNRDWVIRSTGPNHQSSPNFLEFWAPEAQNPKVHFVGNSIKVGIGTTNMPGDYALYVDRGILTERLKVAIGGSSEWADYVFDKDYCLMSLPEVESFITENGHLPNIPSAREVAQNGLDVGEMNARLLEKVEELTLYIIDLEKRLATVEQNKTER